MIDHAVNDGLEAITDSESVWLSFLASPAAPKRAMSALELDGYLTGVIVAPSLIRPSLWMAGLWLDEEPVFDDPVQMQAVLASVGAMFNTLSTKIERSLRRLEAERVCDYRPAFQIPAGKPSHEAVRIWVRGFWRAMQLTSADWHALIADKRTQVIITPLVGFMNVGVGEAIELAEDINDRLDEAAENIPHSILLLKKIAQLRASRNNPVRPTRPAKTGRNDPCPCGSGQKFKRCCGRN
jgi:uncharacterized protein